MSELSHRFFDTSSLERLFESGSISRHLVIDTPRCEIVIDAVHDEVALTAPAMGPEPDVSRYSRVAVSIIGSGDEAVFEIRIDSSGTRVEAYSLLTGIIVELVNGATFAEATEGALQNYRTLLQGNSILSAEQQYGLFGELLVLRNLIAKVGGKNALRTWLGPAGEQHDFAFQAFDAECKTTTNEQRLHVIDSASQLEPTEGRDLWLLSVQITRAGLDSGESLDELIADVSRRLQLDGDEFWSYLDRLNWARGQAGLYPQRYILRAPILAYQIIDNFPAITTTRLKAIVANYDAVSNVSYRINLSGREAGIAPFPLDDLVQKIF